MGPGSIVGRERELEAIRSFLDLGPTGGRALVLEGEAGIGKTTLWHEAIRAASEDGCRVLRTRPSAAEAGFGFSGLGDVLEGSLDEIGTEVPAPQFAALEIALVRREADGPPPDPRAVSTGVLSALQGLATLAPVVVAIDDVQWLDRQSASVLAYAFHRLDEHPVRLIASLRLDSTLPPSELLEAVAADLLSRVRIGPMSSGALHRAIRIRLGRTLSRPMLLRVHQLAGGNPFYALELARTLPEDPGAGIALPSTLERVTRERLERLPAPVRRLLEPAALLATPTASALEQLAQDQSAAGGRLDAAAAAGVIEIDGDLVRFTHPLLAEGMSAMIGPRRRLQLHRRLADVVSDPEERARHLALASDGPDAEVASILDDAARHSRGRGAPDAAAELAELARRLTPPEDGDASRARTVSAAEYHFDAGDDGRAKALMEEAIAVARTDGDRARLLYRLASVSWMDMRRVQELCELALDAVGDEPDILAAVHEHLTWVWIYRGDLAAAGRHAEASMEHVDRRSDPEIAADVFSTFGMVESLMGRSPQTFMAQAHRLHDRFVAESPGLQATTFTAAPTCHGLQLLWSGELAAARDILERELEVYEERGRYIVRDEILFYLAELECRAGNWPLAERYASEALEIDVESGRTSARGHSLFPVALVAAHRGDVERARADAEEGLRRCLEYEDLLDASCHRSVLGFLEISLSNPHAALEHLMPVVEFLDALGAAEPGIIPCIPDAIEGLVALGRIDDAARLVERLEEQGRKLDRPWALATAGRCRGLILAARGDLPAGLEALERAVVDHRRLPQPLELGRTLLVMGELQRRARQRRAARETLHQAQGIFDDLGAPLWSAKARAALSRIGGRAPTGDELTASERRIAEIVAEGRTNREVATALVLSERTVESALTQIYRKLRVRSRTELARRLDTSD